MIDREDQVRLPLQETDPDAQRHIEKVQREHDEQFVALRRRAQGLFTALKGRTGIRTPEEMDKVLERTRVDFDTGAFLVERLGASRYLDPELTCVLIRLRNDLLAEIGNPTASDMMHVDMAILAYRNSLRLQSLINSVLLETERQLFGQTTLAEAVGQTEASEVKRLLEEAEQKLFPLLEKSQRMMNRALDQVSSRDRGGPRANVSIGIAGQVNLT